MLEGQEDAWAVELGLDIIEAYLASNSSQSTQCERVMMAEGTGFIQVLSHLRGRFNRRIDQTVDFMVSCYFAHCLREEDEQKGPRIEL